MMMKKAQLSVAVAVILIIVVLILAAIAIMILLTNPSVFSIRDKAYDTYEEKKISIITKDYEEQPYCARPYIKVGILCCLDANYNNICDKDEKQDYPAMCESPFVKIGSSCCIDDDRNGRCDYTEDRDIDEDAHLGGPFSLYDFDIDDDEITLWIRNRGTVTVVIEMIEIDDCDDYDSTVVLEENERERFDFDCDKDNRFDRDIEVTYHEAGSSVQKTARGNIERDYEYD
jgi:hypothetical protein